MRASIYRIERIFQSWIVSRTNHTARRRNRHRPDSNRYAGVRVNGLERRLCFALRRAAAFGLLALVVRLGRISLRQCEWDRADGEKQKEVKRTSNQVRFDGGVNLFFHFCVLVSFEVEGSSPREIAEQSGGGTCGEHAFSKKRRSESRLFYNFLTTNGHESTRKASPRDGLWDDAWRLRDHRLRTTRPTKSRVPANDANRREFFSICLALCDLLFA
jgi:hypothetical protein